jgi:oxygen-independent coproporphyrinogen-3 oxidase
MLSLGVNRLSVGVQSFHDNELKTLGRIHSSDDAQRSLALIRISGIENFSIDLMYGIPGQDVTSWLESLAKAAEFSPMHISAYELTPEQNTPFFHLLNSNRIEMPEDDQILTMYASGIDYLESRGYAQYEISNFAFRDCECRHNLNYWDRGEYLGAGAGAHSFLNNIRSRNTGDIGKYIEELASGSIPVREPLLLTPEDSQREHLFLGLRKKQGVQLNKSAIFSENGLALCRELIDEGFLEIYGDSIRLTRKGFPVSNAVIVKLFGKFGL